MELKPCPFCPSGGKVRQEGEIRVCDDCGITQYNEVWNTRPIEDKLYQRIIELAQFNVELREKVIIAIGEIEKQLKKLKEA